MAEIRQHTFITIRNETDGDRVPVSTPNEPQGTKSGAPVSVAKAERAQSGGNPLGVLVVAQQAQPYVDQAVNLGVSQIQATTGSAELQQRAQTINGFVSATRSIVYGGIAGGGAGAAMAAGVVIVGATVSAVQNGIAIETNRRIEREAIDRKTSRLGQTINRSRTGGVT